MCKLAAFETRDCDLDGLLGVVRHALRQQPIQVQ